jgi:hypothetical protein
VPLETEAHTEGLTDTSVQESLLAVKSVQLGVSGVSGVQSSEPIASKLQLSPNILPTQLTVAELLIEPDALNTAIAVLDTVAMPVISAEPEYSTPPNAVTVDNPLIAPVEVLTLIESADTVPLADIEPAPDKTLAPFAVTVALAVTEPATNLSL